MLPTVKYFLARSGSIKSPPVQPSDDRVVRAFRTSGSEDATQEKYSQPIDQSYPGLAACMFLPMLTSWHLGIGNSSNGALALLSQRALSLYHIFLLIDHLIVSWSPPGYTNDYVQRWLASGYWQSSLSDWTDKNIGDLPHLFTQFNSIRDGVLKPEASLTRAPYVLIEHPHKPGVKLWSLLDQSSHHTSILGSSKNFFS